MNNQEAIDIIKVAVAETPWNYPLYYAFAFEMAINALEKQDAIEPIRPAGSGMMFCGKCKYPVGKHHNYCSQCGRKVKWYGQGDD